MKSVDLCRRAIGRSVQHWLRLVRFPLMHALIIEDDAFIGFLLQSLLAEVGFSTFDCASTQTQAVVACRAHRPNLITADVRLAQGTGFGAVDEIVREFGLIPTVYVTGNADELSGRTDPVFRKPFSETGFSDTVMRLLAH